MSAQYQKDTITSNESLKIQQTDTVGYLIKEITRNLKDLNDVDTKDTIEYKSTVRKLVREDFKCLHKPVLNLLLAFLLCLIVGHLYVNIHTFYLHWLSISYGLENFVLEGCMKNTAYPLIIIGGWGFVTSMWLKTHVVLDIFKISVLYYFHSNYVELRKCNAKQFDVAYSISRNLALFAVIANAIIMILFWGYTAYTLRYNKLIGEKYNIQDAWKLDKKELGKRIREAKEKIKSNNIF